MGSEDIGLELTKVGAFPASGISEYVIGDGAFSFVPAVGTIGTLTVTLTRRPGGSSSVVAANAVTPDVAGYYYVTVLNGGNTRLYKLVANPASFLALATKASIAPVGSNAVTPTVTRGHLRAIAQQATDAMIAAALEIATPNIYLMTGGYALTAFAN